MAETLAALIMAHVLADFLLQPGWMVAQKGSPAGALAHLAVVLGTMLAALGTASPGVLALAGLHLGIDLIKTGAGRPGPLPFLLDQAAHLASLAALAALEPGLWAAGLWSAAPPALPGLMALAAGAVVATQAGGFLIALLMEPWEPQARGGLTRGGRAIGLLERGLIFALVLAGQIGAIGALIAAKSILRYGTVKDDRKVSEYVIIGTLASVLWAVLAALATQAGLSALPPLGIPGISP